MNSSALSLALPVLAPRTQRQTAAKATPDYPRRPAPLHGSQELIKACAREAAHGNRSDTWSLLFLGGCSLALVAGCAFRMEQFLAQWDSFETLVRSLIG